MSGNNLVKLSLLGAPLGTVASDWIVMADWNGTPQELAASGWLEEVGGRIVLPDNTSYTEMRGRLIDFVVCGGPGLHKPQRVFAHVGGGVRSHFGIVAQYAAVPAVAQALILPTPRRFNHPPRPQRAADPLSRRSLRGFPPGVRATRLVAHGAFEAGC